MVSPFRRKGKDGTPKTSEDTDLNEAISESELIPITELKPSPVTIPESEEVQQEESEVGMDKLMQKSAVTVSKPNAAPFTAFFPGVRALIWIFIHWIICLYFFIIF